MKLEILALRISSLELLSGDAPHAILVSLSKFYQNSKKEESEISIQLLYFLDMLMVVNYEQALAWFYQALNSKNDYIQAQAKQRY